MSSLRSPANQRLALVATLTAVTCAASGAIAIGTPRELPFSQVAFVEGHAQHASGRYHDLEENKARSMRALGLHVAEHAADRPSRYDDLEENKARSRALPESE